MFSVLNAVEPVPRLARETPAGLVLPWQQNWPVYNIHARMYVTEAEYVPL